MKKIVVGITGASGSIYAVRLIDVLREQGIEVHAVITDSGQRVLDYECGMTMEELSRRVDVLYPNTDVGAAIASGSFRMDAMVVLPCSMKTAGAIAHGVTDDLLTRALCRARHPCTRFILRTCCGSHVRGRSSCPPRPVSIIDRRRWMISLI